MLLLHPRCSLLRCSPMVKCRLHNHSSYPGKPGVPSALQLHISLALRLTRI